MIELHVLGPPQVTRDGAHVGLQRKPLALLVYLLLAGNGRHQRRDALLGLLWPEHDHPHARGALRQVLFTLRRFVGSDVILAVGDDEVGIADNSVRCDACAFDQAIEGDDYETAVSLYKGDVLDGLFLNGCPEFQQWLDSQRFQRKQAYAHALEQIASAATVRGEHKRAAQWLERLVSLDPFNSHSIMMLMNALEKGGDRAGAARWGERHIALFEGELNSVDRKVIETLERVRGSPPGSSASRFPLDEYRPRESDVKSLNRAIGERYHILSELGKGSTSSVFLAQDEKLPRQVAVKVLRPIFSIHVASERFQREIQIASALSHPHIVSVIDSGDAGGFLFYVMQFIPGQSVRDRLTDCGMLDIGESVRIAVQVGKALDYSHRQGIVHRDIKPDNVMLHEDVVQVLDFGVALALTEAGGSRLTASGLTIGTPGYMSPEQALGDRDIDGRSDIYSLGCLLYELLTGEPVFTGVTPNAVIAKHQRQAPTAPRILRPEIPVALEQILLKMLAKSPKDRYATAADLLGVLESLPPN